MSPQGPLIYPHACFSQRTSLKMLVVLFPLLPVAGSLLSFPVSFASQTPPPMVAAILRFFPLLLDPCHISDSPNAPNHLGPFYPVPLPQKSSLDPLPCLRWSSRFEPLVDASGVTLLFGETWGWMFWREKCWAGLGWLILLPEAIPGNMG